MTQTFRSRDEQIVALGRCIFVGMPNHTDSMCEAQRHIIEAEARGAAEERERVAALEARVAELEAEVTKLNGGIRNPDDVTCALMDSQYVAGAKFGWNCAQDDDHDSLAKMIERRLRDRIEAGVSFSDRSRYARAALKREGGV